MIDQSKTYRTRDGREVRIYALDGGGKDYPVHGAILTNGEWFVETWAKDGAFYVAAAGDTDEDKSKDLIPSDPHGILPRHRELLAGVLVGRDFPQAAEDVALDMPLGSLGCCWQAALIALARLESSLRSEVGE